MKLADWLLFVLGSLLLVVIVATIARADTMQRTMPFATWVRLTRQCGVRIAAPPVANADGTHTIAMTGDATQLACADARLAKPVPKETP